MPEQMVENLEGKIQVYMDGLANTVISHLEDLIRPNVATQRFASNFDSTSYVSSLPKTLTLKLSQISTVLNQEVPRVIFSDEQRTLALKEKIVSKLASVDNYRAWGGQVVIEVDLQGINPQNIVVDFV